MKKTTRIVLDSRQEPSGQSESFRPESLAHSH